MTEMARTIERSPRFPERADYEAVQNGLLLDAQEYLLEPWAQCIFLLANEPDREPAPMARMGELTFQTDTLRETLEEMLDTLQRVEACRQTLFSPHIGPAVNAGGRTIDIVTA